MRVLPIPGTIAEKYRGAGHVLVAILGGQIVDMVYIEDVHPGFDPDTPYALAAVVGDACLAPTVRALQALGEVSVGMCSCWEFCEL